MRPILQFDVGDKVIIANQMVIDSAIRGLAGHITQVLNWSDYNRPLYTIKIPLRVKHRIVHQEAYAFGEELEPYYP